VLVQTAGHVAAAARFLLPAEVPGLAGEQGKLFPVSHHPTWGGWFAIRAVIIFQDRKAVMEQREPPDLLTDEQKVELVRGYNGNWKDWRWRDVGMEAGAPRYSQDQIRYFETPPVERMAVIRELLEKMSLIGHHH